MLNRIAIHVFFVFLILLISLQVIGQSDTFYYDGKAYTERPKIGLALSGGAAHGFAHIGVLKYMEEIGIPIDNITGTSMGAIIGGLKAMGYSTEKMEDVIKDLQWQRILSNDVPLSEVAPIEKFHKDKYKFNLLYKDGKIKLPQGIFTGHSLDLLLTEIYYPANFIHSFDSLPIPFRCYATDIIEGKVVELKEGSMAKCIRASMAIPTIFTPELHEGKLLVDGGLIRNFPVTNNLEMGSDLVIGSYVGSFKPERTDMMTMVDILRQSTFLWSIEDSEEQRKFCHIYMAPDVKGLPLFKFENYEDYVRVGYESAKARAAEFQKLKSFLDNFPKAAAPTPLPNLRDMFVTKIEVPYGDEAYRELVMDKFAHKERSYLSKVNVARAISRIYATNNFEKINYSVREGKEGTSLLIEGIPRQEISIGGSVNYFRNTNASAIINFSFRNIIARLSFLSLTTRISDNPGFQMDYFIRSRRNKNHLFQIDLKLEQMEIPVYSDGQLNRSFRNIQSEANIGFHLEPDNFLSAAIKYGIHLNTLDPKIILPVDIDDYLMVSQLLKASIGFNSMDKSAFPKLGTKVHSEFAYVFHNHQDFKLSADSGPGMLKLPVTDAYLKLRTSVEYATTLLKGWSSYTSIIAAFQSNNSLIDNFHVGGTQNDDIRSIPFLGAVESELQLQRLVYARQSITYSPFGNLYLSFVANYIYGASYMEQVFLDEEDIVSINRLGYGISLGTNSPIGPIVLDVGFASGNNELRGSVGIGYHHLF